MLILRAISKHVIIIILVGEKKHLRMSFFSKILFIKRHRGKNLHILKKIENGNKMDIFLIKKYVIDMFIK